MVLMIWMARFALQYQRRRQRRCRRPSMSILTPHSALIFWMTLPPEPITSRILSGWILMVSILGAYLKAPLWGRDGFEHDVVQDVGSGRRGSFKGLFDDVIGQAVVLISTWMAVMPLWVPPTLKSMSPKKSSRPWISTMVIQRSPSVIKAAGDTGHRAFRGTPASIRDRVEPQIEPWEVEPLEDRTSETTRRA